MDGDDRTDDRQRTCGCPIEVADGAEDHRGVELTPAPEEDHRQVDRDEDQECHQSKEVQTARTLPSAPQPHEPGEPSLDRRGLRRASENLKRSEQENDAGVGQLLDGVQRFAGQQRRQVERHVGDNVVPRLAEDRPRLRPVPVPLAGGEQQDVVRKPHQDPADHREEVPVPAHAQFLVTEQREQRAVVLLHRGCRRACWSAFSWS